jgi:hypothetical protein
MIVLLDQRHQSVPSPHSIFAFALIGEAIGIACTIFGRIVVGT